jgi:eukaryotic-like serine/threonine-protein kinase
MDKIADYRLVRSLGGGSHGEFFLAEPPARLGLDAEYVAVKVMAGQTPDDAFRRATRELRLFAQVKSPYLVVLYDAGQEGGRFYYAMEYLPLGSLSAPARPLDRAETLRAVADACRAAHVLHEAGIAHRSIKPANILITEEGGGKLSDLGLASFLQPGMTVTGMGPIGSVEYLDPAILAGDRAGRSSDLWSIGVTLHRALTGEGVYGELPESEPLVAIRRVLSRDPVLSDRLTDDERALVEACLAPDAADRPATALDVAERIDALI